MAPHDGSGMLRSACRRASGFEFGVSSAVGRLRMVMVHRLELNLSRLRP